MPACVSRWPSEATTADVAGLDEAPGELLDLVAVPPEQARGVHLQRPALARARARAPAARRIGSVRSGCATSGLRPARSMCSASSTGRRRARERHLDQHDVGALEHVARRVLAAAAAAPASARSRAAARAAPAPVSRSYARANRSLALLGQRQVRPDVRRREQDRGARGGGQVAELEPVRDASAPRRRRKARRASGSRRSAAPRRRRLLARAGRAGAPARPRAARAGRATRAGGRARG